MGRGGGEGGGGGGGGEVKVTRCGRLCESCETRKMSK